MGELNNTSGIKMSFKFSTTTILVILAPVILTTGSYSFLKQWSDIQGRNLQKETQETLRKQPSSSPLRLILLPDEYETQRCLDGTPFGYYIRRSNSNNNSKKWIIFLQGGGLCV